MSAKLPKVILLDATQPGGTLSDEAGALMLAAVRAFIAGDDSDPFRAALAASARLIDLEAMRKPDAPEPEPCCSASAREALDMMQAKANGYNACLSDIGKGV